MIGVLANDKDMPWVTEFFELFKTPWERAVKGRHYEVVLSADGHDVEEFGQLTLVYGADELRLDQRNSAATVRRRGPVEVAWGHDTLPVYGHVAAFARSAETLLSSESSPIDYRVKCGPKTVHRIGYDLFREVAHLLTDGQPATWARHATLELHIAFLKRSIEAARISYIEVPPRPYGTDFVCCLTHDIDFFGIRRHRFDRTMAGFFWRGTLRTIADVIRGRRPVGEGFRNLVAVLSLPLVFLGMARDFWQPFDDYARADRGLPSTFFIVPFKARPGVSPNGTVNHNRAVKYGARDISEQLRAASGDMKCEFAVHGLDAWLDGTLAGLERREVSVATDRLSRGVRMHWLYFSGASPLAIEEAGFEYDSSSGYNDTIGYKAGTMQAFRLPGSQNVLELPMAVMDTAMLYPDYMNLDRDQALERMRAVAADAKRFGGGMVVNWHDRSLAPERQWQQTYSALLDELQGMTPWFATASDSERWFRWRRGVRFSTVGATGETVVEAPPHPQDVPALRLLVSRPARENGTIVEERVLTSATSVVM